VDELDRAMLVDDEIVPSSGFATSVMSAVRTAASAPPPLPFPWGRAWPGFIAAGIVLVALLVAVVFVSQEPTAVDGPSVWLLDLHGLVVFATLPSTVWSVAGIALALVSASIGTRLGRARQFRGPQP
jgi:hypothetical protein